MKALFEIKGKICYWTVKTRLKVRKVKVDLDLHRSLDLFWLVAFIQYYYLPEQLSLISVNFTTDTAKDNSKIMAESGRGDHKFFSVV